MGNAKKPTQRAPERRRAGAPKSKGSGSGGRRVRTDSAAASRRGRYSWKVTHLTFARQIPAAVVAREFERIHEERGSLHAKDIVEAASAPSSPLHPAFFFDDDEKMAQAGRIAVARAMLRNLIVVVEWKDREETVINAFSSVRGVHGRTYELTLKTMATSRREIVLQEALRELEAWKRKYAALSELARLFDAIEAGVKQVK